MSALDDYKLKYEDMEPRKLPVRVGRTFKMSKSNKVSTPVAEAKSYNKTRGEHNKDIVIAILIAGVIAFIGGMYFANKQHAQVENAVKAAQATQTVGTAEAVKK